MDDLLELPRLSPSQAAHKLQVHLKTVWRYMLTGVRGRKLRSFHLGGRRYVLTRDLAEFVRGGIETECDETNRVRRAADAGRILDGAGVAKHS